MSASPLKIVVDCREDVVFAKITTVIRELQSNIPIESKNLLLGDIALVDVATGNDLLLIERKTLQDLLASIKDGRYDEQSHRLINASGVHTHNIYYVLEGLMSQLKSETEKRLVFSSMTSLSFYKGFSVLRTSTAQETADLVVSMAQKIAKDWSKKTPRYTNASDTNTAPIQTEPGDSTASLEPTSSSSSSFQSTASYGQFVKKEKKENITRENIGAIMLSQIPGLSAATAQEILEQYGGSIQKVVEECSSPCPFANATTKNATNGKTRKLGSNVKEALVKYLGPDSQKTT